jgi:cytochrome c oxidase cbb3-type subunit I/II
VHGGALGWNGFMTFGMMYWLLPRLFQTELFSKKLAEWHFWMGTIGILLYIVAIYVAGLTQGLMWRAIDDAGNLSYPDFVETTMAIIPFYYIRAIGGVMFLAGVALGAYNYYMTWRSRPKTYEVPVHEAPPLSATYSDPPPPRHRLSEHGHLEVGKKIDVWMQGHWHRRWERLPFRLTVWVTISVVVASLFEIIPTFLVRSNVPTIATVHAVHPAGTGRARHLRGGGLLQLPLADDPADRPRRSVTASTPSRASSSTTIRSSGARAGSGRTWPGRV